MTKIKNRLLLTVSLLLMTATLTNAQNFQGIATYEVIRDLGSMSIGSDGATPAMKAQIAEMLQKKARKTFVLHFNKNEAKWKETANSDVGSKYRNIPKKSYLEEAAVFGEFFLIKDELPTLEWVLTGETKIIGEYTAKKATTTRSWQRVSQKPRNGNKGSEIVTEQFEVEAWYITELPVSHGPDKYWGLPGLILELDDGKTTYKCTQVAMGPDIALEIKKPIKGKQVSLEEYKTILGEQRSSLLKSLGGN